MSEVKEVKLVGMSLKVPVQAQYVFKVMSAHYGRHMQEFIAETVYARAIEIAKEKGMFDALRQGYKENTLEEWDDNLY